VETRPLIFSILDDLFVNTLRNLPSVDQIISSPEGKLWIETFGRPLTIAAIRKTLEVARENYKLGEPVPEYGILLHQVSQELFSLTIPSLLPVINATGVILHTNLGRAPLSSAAIIAARNVSTGYSNLEFDLVSGKRGSRLIHTEALLTRLTGAQAALVVNNNAAAVLLVLTALAHRRSVVIARSQLVEIGGGFRVPDVMKQSGARLVEIGTTNRVHLSDYQNALGESPAFFLRAHRSNFSMIGFTSEPELEEIAQLAHQANLPVVDDLGSGSIIDTAKYGLSHEPMVQESLAAGSDLVCFSGDKLLGGPQAGIVVGRSDLVEKLRKHPLARAVRSDKLCLAVLSATLLHYLKDEAEIEVPVWRMIAMTDSKIRARAEEWQRILNLGEITPGRSTVGGGSLPGETLSTYVLSIDAAKPDRLLAELRKTSPPIIARLENDRLVFDPRTVMPDEEPALLRGISTVLKH